MGQVLIEDGTDEIPIRISGEQVPSQLSREAVGARIRWLSERKFGVPGPMIQGFADATGLPVSRSKNLIYGINEPNNPNLKDICRVFGVEPNFILWGDLTHMKIEMYQEVRGNERLRELFELKGVDIPEYLSVAHPQTNAV